MQRVIAWPCPAGQDVASELALVFEASGPRLLIIPALFDEANKLRRLTVEVMRRLAGKGIASVLPDLPGCNESLLPLHTQTPQNWQTAMENAAQHFGCTHVLAMRGGALVAPRGLAGWHYAPVTGASQLRQMLRARILAAREAGREETQDSLLARGREAGLDLAGYRLGPDFIAQFAGLVADSAAARIIMPEGPGLWLRAEPGDNPAQADALANAIVMALPSAQAAG